MRLALLFACLFLISAQFTAQNIFENSIGLVLSFEHSEYEPGRNTDRQYMTIGLEYASRFKQIGFRSGFTLSQKFRQYYGGFNPIFITDDYLNSSDSRYLEIPISVQYYPKGLDARFIQPYFSGGIYSSFAQNLITNKSFKVLFDQTTFRFASGLGFLLYLGNHCSIDLQGFLRIPVHSPEYFSKRGKIYGLQTKLNYIF